MAFLLSSYTQPALSSEPHQMVVRAVCSSIDSYTTPNGLNFTTYCGQDIARSAYDSGPPIQNTFTNCMNDCSMQSKRCYGVVFAQRNSSCSFLTDATATENTNLLSNDDRDTALVQASQLESEDTSCPYEENSWQKTDNGMQFSIQCYVDMAGFGDYCSWTLTSCPQHTDTLDGCMDLCSESHLLCEAVSWNPDMTHGYGNCYLKNRNGTLSSDEEAGYITHSALAQLPQVVGGCPSDLHYTSHAEERPKVFDVRCYENRIGTNNITTSHETGLTACMDRCATNSGTPDCLGVVFDTAMQTGFENCLLLSSLGETNGNVNSTFAQIVPSTLSGSSSSRSKAWIAGPVIGGVVAVVTMVWGLTWFRRRRYRKLISNVPGSPDWRQPAVSSLGKMPPVEAEARQSHFELEASDHRAHELH